MELNAVDAQTQETGPYSEEDQQILSQQEGNEEQPQESQELIGGKFKSADDLLEAYQQLEKKLGERTGYQQAEKEDQQETTEENTEAAAPPSLDKESEEAILESIGGEENFKQIQEWAQGNLNQDELEAYNREVNSGDYFRARNALHSMTYAYTESNGSEPSLIGGKLSSRPTDVYRSNQEVVAAMSDPRYLNDDAYTNDVAEKLSRSNVLVPN